MIGTAIVNPTHDKIKDVVRAVQGFTEVSVRQDHGDLATVLISTPLHHMPVSLINDWINALAPFHPVTSNVCVEDEGRIVLEVLVRCAATFQGADR